MEKEIWKNIKGYEGLYQVSNLGRVRSLDRYESHMVNEKEVKRLIKGIIRKGTLNKDGYFQVCISKNGKQETKMIHQLVAEAFIPNPNNYPIINHKDENPSNNCVENLEFCDAKYNNSYGTRTERASKKQINRKDCSKVILQYDLYGNFIKEWTSTKEIERELGYYHSNISKCCNGKMKSAYGYKWSFK